MMRMEWAGPSAASPWGRKYKFNKKRPLEQQAETSAVSKVFFLFCGPGRARNPPELGRQSFPGSRSPPVKANEFGFRTQTKAGRRLLTPAGPPSSLRPAGRPVYKCPVLVLFPGLKVLFVRNTTLATCNMVQRKNQQAARIKRTKQRRPNRQTNRTCGRSTGGEI